MKLRYFSTLTILHLLAVIILAGCQVIQLTPEENTVTVTLVADGTTRVMAVSDEITVADLLRQNGISLNTLDRVNPSSYNRVTEGMNITVVRVSEETVIENTTIPFQSRTMPYDGLPAGEERLLQPGVNGRAEVTYRITYENGVEVNRVEIKRVEIEPAQDEVIMVGSQGELPTVTVDGTLAYISAGNAWIIRQNSANRYPLTVDGGLDGRVFDLSSDGRRLLFTRATDTPPPDGNALATPVPVDDPDGPFNELWADLDTTNIDESPVQLDLENVLFAAWLPGAERTIIYSTAEPRADWPGWQANNDLWRAQISANGGIVNRRQLLEATGGGVYGWYGTVFTFSPDGTRLAWAQPDSVGVLDPIYTVDEDATATPGPSPTPESEEEIEGEEEATPVPGEQGIPEALLPLAYERRALMSFAPWNAYDFIWVPTPRWSPDGRLIAATTHGAPIGSEQPEDSPLFNLSIFADDGGYSVNLVGQSGMWAEPRYSPDGTRLAYLQAIQPLDSTGLNSRYRLIIVDADGSNRRVIYPTDNQPGLRSQQIVWSPDSTQIAVVSPGPAGNILLVDAATGFAQQITSDGQSTSPRWAR